MNSERLRNIRDICIIIISAVILWYVVAEFLFPAVLPFAIAYVIAHITRKPADFLSEKCKISRKLVRPTLAVLIMLFTVGGFIFALVRLAAELWELLRELTADGTLMGIIDRLRIPFGNIFDKLNIASELETGIEEAILNLLSGLLSSAAGIVSSVAAAVPKIVLFIIVCAISTIYFAIDLEKISRKATELLPLSKISFIKRFKDNSLSAIAKYASSYFILMLMTFAMMLFGLTVLGVEYALILSFIISLLDVLPVLGIGIVLIPFSIFSFLTGSTSLGVGLLVLYAAASVIKQIAEPKIVGKNLGIHPLMTLVLMYVGYSVFGIAGLVLLPLAAVLFSALPKKNIPPRSKSESASGSSETEV